jgi:para-aminobenzoate synthetase component 1
LAANAEAQVETFPIKGTTGRILDDAQADAQAAAALLRSSKDRAELSIIVDLMRNDLHRVSRPGTVRVVSAADLLTTQSVHHLQACIRGTLRLPQTLGNLCAALCPGGSITGAPKREVMAAIRAYEGRGRGYFMGHVFYLDDNGLFDSSLLIRSLVGTGDGRYQYAAGSGLVISSDPVEERQEIAAKCRVITEALVHIKEVTGGEPATVPARVPGGLHGHQ